MYLGIHVQYSSLDCKGAAIILSCLSISALVGSRNEPPVAAPNEPMPSAPPAEAPCWNALSCWLSACCSDCDDAPPIPDMAAMLVMPAIPDMPDMLVPVPPATLPENSAAAGRALSSDDAPPSCALGIDDAGSFTDGAADTSAESGRLAAAAISACVCGE